MNARRNALIAVAAVLAVTLVSLAWPQVAKQLQHERTYQAALRHCRGLASGGASSPDIDATIDALCRCFADKVADGDEHPVTTCLPDQDLGPPGRAELPTEPDDSETGTPAAGQPPLSDPYWI